MHKKAHLTIVHTWEKLVCNTILVHLKSIIKLDDSPFFIVVFSSSGLLFSSSSMRITASMLAPLALNE